MKGGKLIRPTSRAISTRSPFLLIIMSIVFRPQKNIWHGSDLSGESVVDGNCDAWNSESADKRGLGSSLVPRTGYQAKLLDQQTTYDCRNFFIVLCVEITPHSGTMFSRKRRSDENRHDDTAPMTEQEYKQLIDEIST